MINELTDNGFRKRQNIENMLVNKLLNRERPLRWRKPKAYYMYRARHRKRQIAEDKKLH